MMNVKSRAIAIFIQMESGIKPTITPSHFSFECDENGHVGGRTNGEWEREYAGTRDSLINQLNRSFGDEQRRMRAEIS